MKKVYKKPNINIRRIEVSLLAGSGNSINNSHGEKNIQYSKAFNQQDQEFESFQQHKNIWDE